MLAISERDSPCSALISPSSLGLVTVMAPSDWLTSMGCGDLQAEGALRALHRDLAAVDGDVDAAGHDDGHPSDS